MIGLQTERGPAYPGPSLVFILSVAPPTRELSRYERGAERAGFEPAVGFYPHAALAKRCFRPLSHLSSSAAVPGLDVPRILAVATYADNPPRLIFGHAHAVARHSRRNRTPCSMSRNRSSCVPTSRSMHSGPR